jgi:DNA-binding transcriptional MerR regulator
MFFPAKPVELLERQYFSIRRMSDATGLPTSVIRYWGTRSARLEAAKRYGNNQRRFLSWQVVLILAVRSAVDDLGMTLEGAIDLMEHADIEGFMQGKRRQGAEFLTSEHLKELLRVRLALKVGKLFGEMNTSEVTVIPAFGKPLSSPVMDAVA